MIGLRGGSPTGLRSSSSIVNHSRALPRNRKSTTYTGTSQPQNQPIRANWSAAKRNLPSLRAFSNPYGRIYSRACFLFPAMLGLERADWYMRFGPQSNSKARKYYGLSANLTRFSASHSIHYAAGCPAILGFRRVSLWRNASRVLTGNCMNCSAPQQTPTWRANSNGPVLFLARYLIYTGLNHYMNNWV